MTARSWKDASMKRNTTAIETWRRSWLLWYMSTQSSAVTHWWYMHIKMVSYNLILIMHEGRCLWSSDRHLFYFIYFITTSRNRRLPHIRSLHISLFTTHSASDNASQIHPRSSYTLHHYNLHIPPSIWHPVICSLMLKMPKPSQPAPTEHISQTLNMQNTVQIWILSLNDTPRIHLTNFCSILTKLVCRFSAFLGEF